MKKDKVNASLYAINFPQNIHIFSKLKKRDESDTDMFSTRYWVFFLLQKYHESKNK